MFFVFYEFRDRCREYVTVIAAVITAGVLAVTLIKDHHYRRHQFKMDLARFYDSFDVKLRDTDYELRKDDAINEYKIYHHMITIVTTLSNIIKFHDKDNLDFKMSYFEFWLTYGYALTENFPKLEAKNFADKETVKILRKYGDDNGLDWKSREDDIPKSVIGISHKYRR